MSSKRLSILYVDDDADVRRVASLALSLDPAIRVTTADSGEAALQIIEQTDMIFDLFLFDVMMPGMTGLDLMAGVSKQPNVAHIPVILMTAKAQQSDIAGYTGAGAVGVIIKPFDPMRLAQDILALHCSDSRLR